ncbi:hypothetical protein VOLCADRAFT_104643 [Volvox carteri f. nagariensis]|uniref:Uncharacterized protein n=1 Tax=Volvox carteri f. nagariensis TaxID=3068 RepID=D8TVI0_VOLCA|nr:uncharacterized protein VOLCADRAFT_104643 [Volvox carteri f. nagariensis]EFJ48581.1 hypothetical protein VOLCADRAFT_104643 [Volvox carteri f. nagariensis]|eukprot:XP_002950380.1 hypothetical protein VOLCADRAFT_104643 [Volvox carteri f. nagariensis]
MGNKRRKVEESESESEDEELIEDVGDDSDDNNDDDNQPGQPGQTRQAIYNVDALHERLEDIGWTTEVDWDETLAVTSEQPTTIGNIEDDLARELAFYNQALSSAQHAIRRFEEAGVPWLRPLDYYAEMVKSDEHMAKVKEQLMFEQRQIEQAEERRKQREAKMYGKQVQLAKQKERNAEKKRQITEISKLRKEREKSGFAGELDMDEQLEELEQRRPLNLKQLGQRGPRDIKTPNKKRQMKNSKFGFGGRKALKKQNDAYSAANMDDYKPGRFKDHFGPRKGGVQKKFGAGGGGAGGADGGKKGRKAGKSQRPGKQRRQAMKAGKGGKR